MQKELVQYITDNKVPDISQKKELRQLTDQYPYFQAAIYIYLKCLYIADDTDFRDELQRLFIRISDKKALFYYILSNEYEAFFNRKGKKEEISESRTNILLSAFFETLDDDGIDKELEEAIVNPTTASTDYFSYLKNLQNDEDSNLSNSSQMKHQKIIDHFIDNANYNESIKFDPNKTSTNIIAEKSDEELSEALNDDLFFTETLARIYIKQQKYERALEIIKRLSLNYPKKNVYFANQISFLEKLIINKQNKK